MFLRLRNREECKQITHITFWYVMSTVRRSSVAIVNGEQLL